MKKSILVVLFCIFYTSNSFAERVLFVNFTGQPVMNLTKGDLQACGVRLMAVDAPDNPSSMSQVVWVPDASFMLDRSSFGMVKAVINKSTVGDVTKGTGEGVIPQEFKTFWMKANGKPATHPIAGEAVDGENKPSKLYVTNTASVMNLFDDVLQQRPIMLGLQFDNGNDIAFSGVVSLSKKEVKEIATCMGELLGLIEKDIKSKVAK